MIGKVDNWVNGTMFFCPESVLVLVKYVISIKIIYQYLSNNFVHVFFKEPEAN